MIPLDETQDCPVFSKIRPGVYIHAPLTVCDYCECTVPDCPMCGGMGPYRPLINVKWLQPLKWSPMLDTRPAHGVPGRALDPQREAYLRKRCTCGSGLGDGLCVNCWPQ